MVAPAGISGQFGYAEETTVGTGVTPTKFLPILSAGVAQEIQRLDSAGIRAGRRTLAAWKAGQQAVAFPVETELWNTDVATLWKHVMGAVATTGTDPYTHTNTPGDLTGKGLTIQVGLPDNTGTVQPFTYAGCKIGGWTLSATPGEISQMSLDVVGMSETTATALATASYDAGLEPFVFTEASLTVGGSAVNTVKSLEITGDNNLTDRFRLGSATSREPLENGMRTYSGSFTADFEGLTEYNRYVNADEFALVALWNNGTDTLTVTMNVRYDGETPSLAGPEMLEQPLPFTAVSATDDATAITVELVNGEATA